MATATSQTPTVSNPLPSFISSAQSTRLLGQASQQIKPESGKKSAPPALTDKKLIKNAMCTDWPGYFMGNKD